MKKAKPLTGLGVYTDEIGQLRAARVVSDGHALVQVDDLALGDTPVSLGPLAELQAEILGIEAASGHESQISVQEGLAQLAIPVVSRFRDNDLALGGQGRPLQAFYLHALARHLGYDRPIAFVDLAAAATLIYVDPRFDTPDAPGALLAFEAGPALAPLEQLLSHRGIAAPDRGVVVDGALELFLDDPFFRRIPPKLVQPDSFALMLELVLELNDADAFSTLCGMSATALLLAMEHLPTTPTEVLLVGRGHAHKRLVPMIRAALDMPLRSLDEVGGHALGVQAQAVAYLAIRAAKGLPTTCPSTTGVHAAVGGGEILRPRINF